MKIIDYDKQDKNTGNSATHIAVDESMDKKYGNIQNAYEEGFASASGVRAGTAETDGRIKHPETGDAARSLQVPSSTDDENAGLADN